MEHDHSHHSLGHAGCASKAADDPAGTVKDPVCGMQVDPHTTPHRVEHAGHPYYFCSSGCRTKFLADPVKYLTASETSAPEPVEEGTIYTCPMHPDVRQVGPGSCPICGMALEPDLATAEAQPNHELIDFTRRFWVGLVAGTCSAWTSGSTRESPTGFNSRSPRRSCCGRACLSSSVAGLR